MEERMEGWIGGRMDRWIGWIDGRKFFRKITK